MQRQRGQRTGAASGRTYTGAENIIAIDGAYHGNTAALIDISGYKHDGPGGQGAPAHVHKTRMPNPYRGPYKGYDSGAAYAQYVVQIIENLESGVCIADEMQVGFGRVGSHFWGFETQGVAPDIVTLSKPIGNGHPLAAVITTRAIAGSFANGMEYFNTFGGNPVSCAVGTAVLDVIEQEGLQANAWRVGSHLLERLTALMERRPITGDVRGMGLFSGVELVQERLTLEPAGWEARYIVERLKEHGILISIDGPLHNVLKLKPPLVFTEENADFLVETLDKVLAEDAVRV